MKLSDALRAQEHAGLEGADVDAITARVAGRAVTLRDVVVDPVLLLRQRCEEALYQRLGQRLYDESLPGDQLRTYVVRELAEVVEESSVPLSAEEREQIVTDITNDVLGFGPIESFLQDDDITEVMVNGDHAVYVERFGRIVKTDTRFVSEAHLRRVIDRIITPIGRRIDESSPMVDARLPDGSRVNAIIPPLAIDGSTLTIRKFSAARLTFDRLIELGSVTPAAVRFLAACVEARANILVSGGTGSGKTTLLNALSAAIPEDERIVTIEDAVELSLEQEHVVRLESRMANVEGRGEISARDLVRNALRMRPDRIIVGEVRSGEALDMLQAMNTGHDGSISTLHANAPRDALHRLETMVLMAGFDLPLRAIRDQAASAIDLIVHIARLRDGSRRVTQITEVEGMQGDVVTLNDIFAFDLSAGRTSDGQYVGTLSATGIRPKVADRLEDHGISLPLEVFAPTPGQGLLR